jgi:hypothetical protein
MVALRNRHWKPLALKKQGTIGLRERTDGEAAGVETPPQRIRTAAIERNLSADWQSSVRPLHHSDSSAS